MIINMLRSSFLATLFIFFACCAYALDYYYVDADASGANDGTSQSDAWESFGDIGSAGWISIDNDNATLYVCGAHAEGMAPEQDGEDGTPIIIDGACPADPGSITAGTDNISLTAEDWFTIQNIELSGASSYGIDIDLNSDNLVVDNVVIHDSGSFGLRNYGQVVVQNSTIYNSGSHGVIDWSNFAGTKYLNNEIYNNGNANAEHGMYVASYSTNSIEIAYNYIHDNGIGGGSNYYGAGIRIYGSCSIHHNWISGNGKEGIAVHFDGAGTHDPYDYYWYGNVITGNGRSGISFATLYNADTINAYVYNNTLHKNRTEDSGSPHHSEFYTETNYFDTLEIKNNIFYADTDNYCVSFEIVSVPGADIDNNLYYGGQANHHYYNSAARTWATWQGYGFDASGYDDDDPLLNNPGSDEYWVQSGSDAINGGDNTLGATHDDGLENELAISAFPDSVVTVDRDNTNTSGWDIGAYEYEYEESSSGVSIN